MNNTAYCAFLRGINVNDRRMKMAEVCDVFRTVGMTDLISVLASGNILFRSERPQADLRSILEAAMTAHYDDEVNLFVKNMGEIETILSCSPFVVNAELHIYAFICEPMFETVLLDEFGKITPDISEKACVNNGNFYWQCAKGKTLESGFSKILGRKTLRDKFTSRNLETVAKIQERYNKGIYD